MEVLAYKLLKKYEGQKLILTRIKEETGEATEQISLALEILEEEKLIQSKQRKSEKGHQYREYYFKPKK